MGWCPDCLDPHTFQPPRCPTLQLLSSRRMERLGVLYQSRVALPYNLSSTMAWGRDGAAGTETSDRVGGGGRCGEPVSAVSARAAGRRAAAAARAVAGATRAHHARGGRGAWRG